MARLALLSVSDKSGIVELARRLVDEFQFDLISSGGTAKTLKEAGVPVTKVSDYTGAPEILGGRVKTLHPRIHGGILARRDLPSDQADLQANDIRPLDLVVVNLYPFEATIAKPGVTVAEAVEQIDIGGPAMIRATAKNFAHTTVLTNPNQYEAYLGALQEEGEIPLALRQQFAGEAFALTNAYDQAIANYFSTLSGDSAARFGISGTLRQPLRYGENPHQSAGWYQTGREATGWAKAEKLQGKELSYNNLVDLEAARRIINEFDVSEPAAVILKHTNPCGVALAPTLVEAYQKAFNADATSAFGGIVALNQPLDGPTATAMVKTFLECIVAPGCNAEAREILAKKNNLRVLILSDLATGPSQTIKAIAGGLLVQSADDEREDPGTWQVVTEKEPSAAELAELAFAWKVCKHVKSNAITITKNKTTLGVGAGQMNRVGSVEIALKQAGIEAQGACLASDAFFPFDDSVRTAAAAGITTIIQPGGSLRDKDSIQAANELGLVMIFTGVRHFLH
ncbi:MULTISPECIES: bifunctional phosphoribosylaminoimidazolecarboxamide formyltransferase/IMP cyclohydrolase [unclassified Synechocystis]|uniref:bifunctional phosphoribosylaminoimidazolecarboxamide formyltransferase/IMP cyclohydrolase n=1 Tax=unclassified Synechocystis TaxID=2640012 RepID=UPI00040851B4|nr:MULTISPECIES: bifunctional phosphoribosylaminoimidazolecarboxamide formyltransferase/IMP cyclohydrolase [unclassified Synechocystis]AIE75317.1 IMP cyclohydrolase / Phosphoribosylaminoimidazolecarboxamide formyltransferase [Synechocystis sp. PCC 6714]MCT0253054.1 bifunctional phosphoribosylaminoimidazolecarboxamide formyltransferase/IMP cyclohydrolase [Synechocystis sp. CS-94]